VTSSLPSFPYVYIHSARASLRNKIFTHQANEGNEEFFMRVASQSDRVHKGALADVLKNDSSSFEHNQISPRKLKMGT
jgi:hypothetical protein